MRQRCRPRETDRSALIEHDGETQDFPDPGERKESGIGRIHLAMFLHVRFNRFDLDCEHIDRRLAHLTRSGEAFVCRKVAAHTILPALDMMARDLHP
jgi:hypothetical protein